ncbi:MAG TPA: M20/M25/M40 family metallo-hydrolase [Solirubrobacterales bacterium]|nr:M20/M25/M40 family metallo-hydrolase [Solirubrobacterales bacterium]HMY26091.1 M20/M25/M40 family metallo-hydrolase [Solirubrobacterales bacterium]HNA23528.1 M20/M25/M40 family metallo-hydrolase [Solirubrobacterales bacterium]HNA45154.1 M20/M25/M40 family metallo-hydrolase [Solirubrobacterales bacterium]HNI39076.1 M20/M25/M40 family metallo-hydrolase [Solirubrobacterales bacterium]
MDELLALAEQLIGYDTSSEDGVHEAAGFIKGWLDSRGVETEQGVCRGLPVITASHGDPADPTVILHGHIDVVPAGAGQFEARVEGDRLIGRGTYDMKAALAAMMLTLPTEAEPLPGLRVVLGIVSDEESEEAENRGSNFLVREPDAAGPDRNGGTAATGGMGLSGDFAITGEPTDMHVGVAAKGVLGLRLTVAGRAAHGSTPWLGENAVLLAVDMFRGVESLPFATESSELFDRPSINLGRIWGGDALNKVPDSCAIDVDIRYLPHQDPAQIRDQIAGLGPARMETIMELPPVSGGGTDSPWIQALTAAASRHHEGLSLSVGRDGASDAVSFIRAGIPAVEFGPAGAGHHGPDEWVSIPSLIAYRSALKDFLKRAAKSAGRG